MNTINFIRTKYEDFNGAAYGFRAYDDYGAVYSNNDETPMPTDDKDFLEIIRQNGSAAEFIDFMIENGVGCYIDGARYDYEEIKDWIK